MTIVGNKDHLNKQRQAHLIKFEKTFCCVTPEIFKLYSEILFSLLRLLIVISSASIQALSFLLWPSMLKIILVSLLVCFGSAWRSCLFIFHLYRDRVDQYQENSDILKKI